MVKKIITMVSRKIIESRISGLPNNLVQAGFLPAKIILFGSCASGKSTDNSDIDLAIWAKGFSGVRSLDIENIADIISKYPLVELHNFLGR